jgi:Phage QLRG family, putative DNA packaging.
MLELMKLLLGIQTTDNSFDEVLNIFITKALAIIIGYCNVDTLPENYNNAIAQYSVYLYMNRDSEGLSQKTEGEKSVVYEGAIPESIKLQLPLPRVKVVG